jgi:hypothetical protein
MHQSGRSGISKVEELEEAQIQVWSEFAGVRENFNAHLVDFHNLERANADSLFAYCEVDMIDYPEDIDALSAPERLELLRQEVEIVVACAFNLERLFNLHMNEFHEPLDYRWQKFYSHVPESLPYKEKLSAVSQNVRGLGLFAAGLRSFYDDHLSTYH